MVDEYLACIDEENIKYLHSGQIAKYIYPVERKRAHRERIAHLIVRIFILTKDGGDILYLVQKRGKNKKGFPEYFTDSASGHVEYEDDMDLGVIQQNALRELEEEFGINPNQVEILKFHGLEIEKDKFTGEIAYLFFGMVNADVQLTPDHKELEVKDSKFYSKAELQEILSDENTVDYSKYIWKYLMERNIEDLFPSHSNLTKSEKKKKISLYVGRFQPFHKGHHKVIIEAIKQYKLLKIGIGSAQLSNQKNDPFSADERRKFIEGTLKEDGISKDEYEVYEIPDIFNAKKWVSHVEGIIGDFEVVISNSDWVRELFAKKGYILSEKKLYQKKEYNGTNIRNLIANDNESWKELVPNPVRDLIVQFNGISRIKDLHEKEKRNKE